MAAPAAVHALQTLLEQRFPDAVPITRRSGGGLSTGIPALDRALPGGGLPRGKLSAWAPGTGVTAILRAACSRAAGQGERTAWIDGEGVAWGERWRSGAVLLRPATPLQGLEAAEVLLRSGGFALVVLSGVRAADTERVRLSRALREGGSALALVDDDGFLATLRIALRARPEDVRWRRGAFGDRISIEEVVLRAEVRAPGWDRDASFSLPLACDGLRMSLEPGLGDRRGGAR